MFCIISAIGCLKYAYGLQERVSLCEQKQEQIRKEYDKDISEIKTKLDKIYDFLLNR